MTIDGNLAAASAMAALEKRLEVATSNLAGVQKAGYQWRQAVTRTVSSAFESELGLPPSLVRTDVKTSFAPGMPVANANPLSLALKSEGFFEVTGKDGPLYTRNGDFVVASDGTLTTRQGFEVVAASGRLKADPSGGPVAMNALGELSQAGRALGRVNVVTFDTPERLEAVSDTMFRAPESLRPDPVAAPEAVAGHLERPVQGVIDGLIEMVSVQRAYEAAQRAARAIDDASMNRIRQS